MAAVVVVGVDGGGVLQGVHLYDLGVGARVWTAAILPAMVAMRVSRWRGSTMLVGNAGARMAMSSRGVGDEGGVGLIGRYGVHVEVGGFSG